MFTEPEALDRLTAFASDNSIRHGQKLLRNHSITELESTQDADGHLAELSADDIAFVQYSSGSTSEPKGIVLTHRNLTSTVHSMSRRLEFTADDIALSWMPLTHDMGLIGYHLTMLATGMDHAIMDTSRSCAVHCCGCQKPASTALRKLRRQTLATSHYLKAFERKRPENLGPVLRKTAAERRRADFSRSL